MTSSVVDAAIAAAGWDRWLARRMARDLTADDVRQLDARVGEIDLLVLGAMADRVRAHEHGEVVRLHLQRPMRDDGAAVFTDFDPVAGGGAFLRRVAHARLRSHETPGNPVRIDVEGVGIELAQVALAFGASELVAPIRRSVITGDAVLRERELAALVVAAGRVPRIVEWLAGAPRERDVDATTEAKRRFRAPGRDIGGDAT